MKRAAFWFLIVGTSACGGYYRPAGQPAPSQGTAVQASFGTTWDAVIDVFAEQGIPITTLERASGLIVAGAVPVDVRRARVTSPMRRAPSQPTPEEQSWADCGEVSGWRFFPDRANFSVVVRGDSVQSTIKVHARWWIAAIKDEVPPRCVTRGVWESGFEQNVHTRATNR